MDFDFTRIKVASRVPSIVWMPPEGLKDRLDAYPNNVRFLTPLQRLIKWNSGRLTTINELSKFVKCGPFGSNLLAEGYSHKGVCVIRPVNILNWSISVDGLAFLPEHECLTKGLRLYKKNTLVFARVGNIAVGIIPHRLYEFTISPNIIATEIKDSSNSYYLCAFLNSMYGTCQLERALKTVAQPTISTDTVRNLRVPIPHHRIQDYIGAKVELAEYCRTKAFKVWNEASCLLSETMGVPMNEETFFPKSPQDVSAPGYSVASVSPAIAQVSNTRIQGYIGAQFFHPRRAKAQIILEQSGLETKRLSELANRFAERLPAADFYEHGYPYFGLANIDSTFGFLDGEISDDISGTCALFRAGDILFSKLRPYLNKVTICPEHIPQACGSTELVVYRAKKGIDPYFLFFILKSPLVLNQVINITSGSTHPRVDPNLINEVLIPIPEKALQYSLGEKTRKTLKLLYVASRLVDEAKSDVQNLIEGTLDNDSIITGKLKPISQKDISSILNKEILQ